MFRIMTADEAVQLIDDNAWLGLNPFLSLSIPHALHDAIMRRYLQTGHPNHLNIYSPCGFGVWDEHRAADQYAAKGAVQRVVTSHYASIPAIARMTQQNEIEAYCLPLGVMSHSIRDAAAGYPGHLSHVGLDLFVDPRRDGPGLNERSRDEWVQLVELRGEEYLYYKTPEIDVALIKGTSVDPMGNISFSDECVICDALALAQATKARGGTVIVQVDRVSHTFERPRSVIIPGILVDVVVVDYVKPDEHIKAMDGSIHVPGSQMDYWMAHLARTSTGKAKQPSTAHSVIGQHAAQLLRKGDVVNIGIGIPEMVGQAASSSGILRDIVLTVESGGLGGLPAPGQLFGATIGADCIVSMAEQFDFYDGGGLSICFMGALEMDSEGNVNAHQLPDKVVGIGGFANITSAAKTVVFCLTTTAKGLEIAQDEQGTLRIVQEGQLPKFKKKIGAISFSAKQALARGQRVLYVTERCVFELTEAGLRLAEVYPGIDRDRDVLPHLEFPLAYPATWQAEQI
ncbi:propionate CoA-transferase [Eubacteriales bacterium OttesenSCG-928-N13]|nr:propionate CoA-transferase [Eubacteriales bacterium OttesenSCG-928-N13]